MPRPPRSQPSTRHSLAEEWVPIKNAFTALGLALQDETHRRVWTYFVSASVRVAHRYRGKLTTFEGPYAVIDGEGRLAPLVAPRMEGRRTGEWLARSEDVAYILDYVPYLFDSVGAIAWKVDTDRLLWHKAAERPEVLAARKHVRRPSPPTPVRHLGDFQQGENVPLSPAQNDAFDLLQRPQSRDLATSREMAEARFIVRNAADIKANVAHLPMNDPERKRAVRRMLSALNIIRGRTPDALLDDHARLNFHEGGPLDPNVVARDWRRVADNPDLFRVLGEPWHLEDVRGRTIASVSPPFTLGDKDWAPAELQGRNWLDDIVQDWKGLEQLGRSAPFDEVLGAVQDRVIRSIEGEVLPSPLAPGFLSRAEQLKGDKSFAKTKPFVVWTLESIRNRRKMFLRACKSNQLGGISLPQEYCKACGSVLERAPRKVGRPSKFCQKSECKDFAIFDEETRQRNRARDFDQRRNTKPAT